MPRKSRIDTSAHREEIEHLLIEQRWSAETLARYLELKHDESIPPGSLRTWRLRRVEVLRKSGKLPRVWADDPADGDETARAQVSRFFVDDAGLPDVLKRRIALMRLQEQRVRIDAEHEISMGKQFASQGKEIDLLNRLYDAVKRDMQELGFLPRPEAAPQTVVNAFGGAGGAASAVAASKAEVKESQAIEELLASVEGVDPLDLRRAGRAVSAIRLEAVDQAAAGGS